VSAESADPGDGEARAELLSVLNTEYFVLQGASTASISEAGSRSSLYLLSLSSALVSLGFVLGAAREVFIPFATGALIVVFVLGWFTVARLMDTTVENIRALRAMARIRRFYHDLHPAAPSFFATSGKEETDAAAMLAIRSPTRAYFGTMASMIGAVNSVVGGSGIALLATSAGMPLIIAITLAIVIASTLVIGVLLAQRRRFQSEFSK
jgi:predicted signal transduction protein with EAL and GGDEF domain